MAELTPSEALQVGTIPIVVKSRLDIAREYGEIGELASEALRRARATLLCGEPGGEDCAFLDDSPAWSHETLPSILLDGFSCDEITEAGG